MPPSENAPPPTAQRRQSYSTSQTRPEPKRSATGCSWATGVLLAPALGPALTALGTATEQSSTDRLKRPFLNGEIPKWLSGIGNFYFHIRQLVRDPLTLISFFSKGLI